MKMREELELYKGKSADAELHIANLNIEHDDNVRAVHEQYQMQIKDTKVVADKALENKTSSLKYAQDSHYELQSQLSALHDILDVIPGVLTRKKEDGYGEHACHVRLASVLAQKFM